MTAYRVWIPGRLPGMNEIIDGAKCRYNRNARGKESSGYQVMKKRFGRHLTNIFRGERIPQMKAVRVHFDWIESPGSNRDPDNIDGGGRKFLLDAMVKAGIIRNDTRRYVKGLSCDFPEVRPDCGVMVTIEELAKGD